MTMGQNDPINLQSPPAASDISTVFYTVLTPKGPHVLLFLSCYAVSMLNVDAEV